MEIELTGTISKVIYESPYIVQFVFKSDENFYTLCKTLKQKLDYDINDYLEQRLKLKIKCRLLMKCYITKSNFECYRNDIFVDTIKVMSN